MDFTLTGNDVVPEGTTIEAHAASDWLNSKVITSAAPPGTAVDSQTMGDGTVTFTGLDPDVRYVAYADIGTNDHRYIFFATHQAKGEARLEADQTFTGDVTFAGELNGEPVPATVAGARDDPEAALANLLTALADLGLITDTTTAT